MPSEIVEKVKESRWMRDGEQLTTWWVTLLDQTGEREVPSYDPAAKDLKEDAPLPDGWEVKTSQKGKLYLAAPKPPGSEGKRGFGGKPAWANTEEGEKYVQERMDRRTALMQALLGGWKDVGGIILVAEQLYEWLRKNLDVSAPGPRSGLVDDRRPVQEKPVVHSPAMTGSADTPLDGGGESSYGEAPPPSSINSDIGTPPTNADTCPICGKEWGPNRTSTGKRVCVQGHVERFDSNG